MGVSSRKLFRVCLTGGGTAGHVTPHFALLPHMRQRGWDVFYVGSNGIEKTLVASQGVPFKEIASGKLRRYFSVQNFLDVFKVGVGVLQAFGIMMQQRPDVVFSKGGFVSVPVAVAAWLLRVPVVSHESDVTPGLANKLIAPFATRILYTFPETQRYLPSNALHAGTPVRDDLFKGDARRGAELCGFDQNETLPTLLVMGGSQGAQRVNDSLKEILPWLVEGHRVIHLTGAGKGIGYTHPRYKGFEFVKDELKDLLALADFVISRAGANAIFEFVSLKKPMLLVPLEAGSRGDQVVNAESFAKSGWARVLREKDLTPQSFRAAIEALEAGAAAMREQQATYAGHDAAEKILGVLSSVAAPSS